MRCWDYKRRKVKMKKQNGALHFLIENDLAGWFVWYAGMCILIAGMLAMFFFKATYLETPMALLVIPLTYYFLHKLNSKK